MMGLEERMQRFVERQGIPLEVCLAPDPNNKRHAEIVDRTIIIYTQDPVQAWHSLIHEICELRLRPVLKIYRDGFNALLSMLEQVAYQKKEEAIEGLIQDHNALWRELSNASAHTDTKNKETKEDA